MDQPKYELPDTETLLAAALYLATNYAKTGCPRLCDMIIRQLNLIRGHSENAAPQATREFCGRLLAEWEKIRAERVAALRAAICSDPADPQRLH